MASNCAAWMALSKHFNETGKQFNLKSLFQSHPDRFEALSRKLGSPEILIDFSKNLINEETLRLLLELAKEAKVEEARDLMFQGFPINCTEGRAVLHTALRAGTCKSIPVRNSDGAVIEENIVPAVQKELSVMKRISESVRSGEWKGHTGKRISDIVNIGIGGSDLGPVMVCEALKAHKHPEIDFHFVSNVDGGHLATVLTGLDPETTLFIIVSKTFTTAETMKNAQSARSWILDSCDQDANAIAKHFVAVSTNLRAVREFGIDAERNSVQFWDWVGGRYSLWSGVGLSIMMSIGPDGFDDLLLGAREIDSHFLKTPLDQNIPVLMALIGIWYNNFWGCETLAVLPYEQALSRFPAYLQQADMESNGKGCTSQGSPISNFQTGPIVWGEPGTNGQHAFFQLIHQGTKIIPCDFLAGVNPIYEKYRDHHTMLLANFLAQTEALMVGKDLKQVEAEHPIDKQLPLPREILLPQKTFPGNRPSTSILYNRLDPRTLGALLALYEHKIFVQGIIWQVNSFDQWGVELGKQLATKILKELEGNETGKHDQSTQNLINYILSNH